MPKEFECFICGDTKDINKIGHAVCKDCHSEINDQDKRIIEFIKAGHSDHCAKRQVWGDGECECGLDEIK